MARSNCTMASRSLRTVGLAALPMTTALISSSCAHEKPSLDSPLFQGCRLLCESADQEPDSVTETEKAVLCECRKPAGKET